MPVSYDASSLLKCTVSMSYIRYYITDGLGDSDSKTQTDPALDRAEPEPIREPPDSLPTPPTPKRRRGQGNRLLRNPNERTGQPTSRFLPR